MASLTKCKKNVKAATKVRPARTYDYKGPTGALETADVKNLDISVPVFRLENGRTKTLQASYIQRNKKPKSFFSDNYSDLAQEVQRELLTELTESTPRGKKFIDDLRKEGQQAPLIITDKGVVLNGNRRLAVMRKLYDEGEHRFKKVTIAVCPPDWSEDDLIKVEEKLQISEEYRQDYTWDNEALMFKAGYAEYKDPNKRDMQCLARWGKSEKEVEAIIGQLEEAELYLKSRDIPGRYEKIREHLQIWIGMQNKLWSRKGQNQELTPDMRDAMREIVYTHVDCYSNPNYSPTGSNYTRVNALMRNVKDTINCLADSRKVARPGPPKAVPFGSKPAAFSKKLLKSNVAHSLPAAKCKKVDEEMKHLLRMVKDDNNAEAPRNYIRAAADKLAIALTHLSKLSPEEVNSKHLKDALKLVRTEVSHIENKLKSMASK